MPCFIRFYSHVKMICLIVLSVTLLFHQVHSRVPPSLAMLTFPSSRHTEASFSFSENAISRPLKRIWTGVTSLPTNFRVMGLLKKKLKEEGEDALSYSEYRYLQTVQDDIKKCLRIGFTAWISPELLLYSYFIIPALSPTNPWAWVSLPSTFDTDEDSAIREKVKIQRRQSAVIKACTLLIEETFDDGNKKTREVRESQLRRLKRAVSRCGSSMEGALKELEPMLKAKKRKSSKGRLELDNLPWPIVREAIRSFGRDGVPNIFFLRRLNKGELSNHFLTLKGSDEHIEKIGVRSLDDNEVINACSERCISIDTSRSIQAMRKDLDEWIQLVRGPAGEAEGEINAQKKRLALCSLHAVNDIAHSDFMKIVKTICK